MFDFGNKTALKNLRALDLTAAEADLAVLSHGHSGAGGGLKELAPALRGIKIYARESAFDAHYFKKSRLSYKTVSLPKKLPREGFSFVKSFLKIDDELSIISNFKPTKQVLAEPRYFVDGDRFFEPDTFSHELALIVSDEDSLTLFVGGAHAGLMQIIERAEKTFSKQVGKVVGALELTDKKGKPLYSEERTRNFAFELENSRVRNSISRAASEIRFSAYYRRNWGNGFAVCTSGRRGGYKRIDGEMKNPRFESADFLF